MSPPGLRERKKAKTRRTIVEQAMRLFAVQGYEATTVEQIAEAAEISPSTIFRYFPTKEDLVLRDDYHPLLLERLAAQPKGVPTITTMRQTFREALALIPPGEESEMLTLAKIQMEVPAIRARMLQNGLATMELLARGIAERENRDPDDLAVLIAAGAMAGALLPTMRAWAALDGARPLPEMIDEALGLIERGLPI